MKKEELKKRIFETSWKIVEREGILELNIRKIAQSCSCAVGSIYTVFGSFDDLKLHLYASILKELYSELKSTVENAISENKSLRDLFKDLGITYIEFGKKHRQFWKALFEQSNSNVLPDWYVKHTREGIFQICKHISKAYNMTESAAKQKVGFFWASMHGVSAICLNPRLEMLAEIFDPKNLEPYLDYCLDGLIR